jgi:hypothetical protein
LVSHSSTSASPLSLYQHPLSLCISIPSLSVSASPLSQYQHPWSLGMALLGIGIPSSSVLESLTPRYWHPSHFGILSISGQCSSLALGLLSTTPPQFLPPLASFPYTHSTPLSITVIPTHQPTSFIKTHKHSLWKKLFTAIQHAGHSLV